MTSSTHTDFLRTLTTCTALIKQFQKSLNANGSATAIAGDHPSPLLLLKAAAESLKSSTTKLSLLCITPPFTDSAVISLLKPLNESILPSLVTAALLVTPASFPDAFAAEANSLANAALAELLSLLVLVERRANDGKSKSEPGKDAKQAVTEATGRVWSSCDEIIKFSKEGIPKFVTKKAEQWLALMKDAVQELQEWDPDEDVDEDIFGDAGSDDDDAGPTTYTDKVRDHDQATIAAGVKDQAIRVLSRIPQSVYVVVKQRLAKMPVRIRTGEQQLEPKHKEVLENIIKLVRVISECIDESAEGMYMGNPELCLKKAGEARALTIEVVESVLSPWESASQDTEPTKEDIFIKRALAWIQQVDANTSNSVKPS